MVDSRNLSSWDAASSKFALAPMENDDADVAPRVRLLQISSTSTKLSRVVEHLFTGHDPVCQITRITSYVKSSFFDVLHSRKTQNVFRELSLVMRDVEMTKLLAKEAGSCCCL